MNSVKPLTGPMDHLQQLSFAYKRAKYPSVPVESIPRTKYTDKTANGLTKCVLDFLKFEGWQAERISSTGRVIDQRTSYTDVVGRSRTIGSLKWIKGSGTVGTADISATIAGKAVKIEIKIGADRQSDAQRQYQTSIEQAGGLYVIAKTFAGFYSWYYQNFKSNDPG